MAVGNILRGDGMVTLKCFLQRVDRMPKKKALNSIRGKMSVLKREKKRKEAELKKLRAFQKKLAGPQNKKSFSGYNL